MSLLAEVISAANKIEVSTIVQKTSELVVNIENSKQELMNYLDSIYIKFSQPARQSCNLSGKVNWAANTLSQLEQSISEVTKREIDSTECDLNLYGEKLSVAKEELQILESLIDINKTFVEINEMLKKEQFLESVESIHHLRLNIKRLHYYEELNILEGFKQPIEDIDTEFLQAIYKKFCCYVDYTATEKTVIFNIKSDNSLQEIFTAYDQWNEHIEVLNDIARFLWDNFFCLIVNCKVIISVSNSLNSSKLQLEIIDKNNKTSYKEVFDNIIKVNNYFENYLKFSLSNGTTLEYIGNDIKDNLSEMLIKNCLTETIPINSQQLEQYEKVVKDVNLLESNLLSSGLFSDDMHALSEYVKNIDEHYIRQKCQIYLKTANAMIQKDLHDMIEVGEPMNINQQFNIDQHVFYQRSVSKSCIEILNITKEMLEQIPKSPNKCGEMLLDTVRDIFSGYGIKVAEYHQRLLQTIPQQVALFMNNCVYLSHKLMSWEESYGKEIGEKLNIEESLFSSEIRSLMQIGNNTFEEFIGQQIKQMEQILKESGLMNIVVLEHLEPVTEKCIRQCLRQQELLKTVWNKVLTYTDYNKSLGITMNFLCKSVIDAVVKLEDIPEKGGQQLVDVLKIILTRGPKLFSDSKDVFVYVEQWHKLNELVFVLNAKLLEIADRWADGKGPLALQLKSEELKNLIKAVFQNTDRRAAVLAHIKPVH